MLGVPLTRSEEDGVEYWRMASSTWNRSFSPNSRSVSRSLSNAIIRVVASARSFYSLFSFFTIVLGFFDDVHPRKQDASPSQAETEIGIKVMRLTTNYKYT